jgi:uncharacterized protein with FMN-binding domain
MRRAPIVITATAAGLAGVLSFHSKAASLTAGGLPGAAAAPGSTTSVAAASPPGSGATPTPTSTTTSSPNASATSTAPSSTSTTATPSTRSATGPQVNYNYGVVSVSVTVSGKKITKVGIASLDDGGSSRSQSIDQQSIPVLEQQALQAQSANIQGVSGASYTSAGFAQSLQAALSKLGL